MKQIIETNNHILFADMKQIIETNNHILFIFERKMQYSVKIF